MGSQWADDANSHHRAPLSWEERKSEPQSLQEKWTPLLGPQTHTLCAKGCTCPPGMRSHLCHPLSWQSIRSAPDAQPAFWVWQQSWFMVLPYKHRRDAKWQLPTPPIVCLCLSKSKKVGVGWLFPSYNSTSWENITGFQEASQFFMPQCCHKDSATSDTPLFFRILVVGQ